MKTRTGYKLLTISITILFVLLAGTAHVYSEYSTHTLADNPSPEALQGIDAKAAIELANRWHEAGSDVLSYVDQRNVYFEFNNGEKAVVPLPENSMVIAIAPYLTYTHDCTLHYMSACQSEMADTALKVFGRTESGMVVVDGTFTTLSNGFIELWLPRNEEIELTIEAVGKQGFEKITTFDTSRTCITTIQLR